MEYQKNIATNVYHGFGALINLIVLYVTLIQMKTGLTENSIVFQILTILLCFVFIYHMLNMKKIK